MLFSCQLACFSPLILVCLFIIKEQLVLNAMTHFHMCKLSQAASMDHLYLGTRQCANTYQQQSIIFHFVCQGTKFPLNLIIKTFQAIWAM